MLPREYCNDVRFNNEEKKLRRNLLLYFTGTILYYSTYVNSFDDFTPEYTVVSLSKNDRKFPISILDLKL